MKRKLKKDKKSEKKAKLPKDSRRSENVESDAVLLARLKQLGGVKELKLTEDTRSRKGHSRDLSSTSQSSQDRRPSNRPSAADYM